ncbi:MAG: magnesium-protoporphyrin IX monomethyl ester (oxidative) cyclase [Myxococcota bacterium]
MNTPARDPSTAFSTEKARQDNVLSPRFYTTDFDAIDRIDVGPVRAEWDALMAEMRDDRNRDHFERPESAAVRDLLDLSPELAEQFTDFLISSLTSEFSGCLLYAEAKRRTKNEDMRDLFGMMARDESRHAGFINTWLKDLGIGVDLGILARTKKQTFFKPKYIFYATYLSEKIGYARYITIFRQIQRRPDLRFHPIFGWFEQWCNDEYRHGEALALIMRADPSLLEGLNRLWIRFFLVAVFSTMYVRDHTRPHLHRALGLDPTSYDLEVFRITSEITRQVFPFTLDIEDPRFLARLERLRRIAVRSDEARARGGLSGALVRAGCSVAAVATLVSLYFSPTEGNALPENVRLAPTW